MIGFAPRADPLHLFDDAGCLAVPSELIGRDGRGSFGQSQGL